MNEESRLSYILAILIAAISLQLIIISDVFSRSRISLYEENLYLIITELFISWALIILIIIFLLYLFLEGLHFTDNNFLRILSENPDRIYSLGFEFMFYLIPFVIVMILGVLDYYILLFIFSLFIILYFKFIMIKIYKHSHNVKNHLFLIIIIFTTFLPYLGIFQIITSDININFDKDYYCINDYAIIKIDKIGITLPVIKEFEVTSHFIDPDLIYPDFYSPSNENEKMIVIINISNMSMNFKDTDSKIITVKANYSKEFLWLKINKNKYANFIVLNQRC